MRFLGCSFAVLLAGHLGAVEPTFRVWTDTQRRTLEAAVDHETAADVVLTLRDGKQVTVPVASLSAADQKWLKDSRASAPMPEANPGATAAAEWPRTVLLKDAPVVHTVSEDTAKKQFIYESDHYEFLCDSKLSENLVRAFSRVFEVTWLANSVLPLDLKPKPEDGRAKFRARIFTFAEDYREAGGMENSAGVYMRGRGMLMLPLDSLGVKMVGSRVSINYLTENYETLVHETTHQMMNHWLDRLPVWYIEGSAEYVTLAPYDNGRLSFLRLDLQLQKHLSEITSSGRFQMVPLERLMTISHQAWAKALTDGDAAVNYASALALTYYFYQLDGDGKGTFMRDYLRAVEKLPPNADSGDLVKKHLLRARDYPTLQRDVQAALRRAGIAVEFAKP